MAPCGWCRCFSLACHCSFQYPSSPGCFCCFARCLGCATLLSLWLCAHWSFFCFLPALRPPSGSGYTGSSASSSLLGFPTFAMGSPLRGRGLFVLDRNEGLVSPFGSGPIVHSCWPSRLCLRVSAHPVPQGVLPSGPRCVLHLRFSLAPGVPLCGCGFSGILGSLHCAPLTVGPLPGSPALFCLLSAGCLLGLESSPSGEASASSCRFSGVSPPAPWGYRCACCLPSMSQREFFPLCLVLPLPGSITFSRVCSSVGGPVGVAHSFHPSLLLGGGLVRFCGGLC